MPVIHSWRVGIGVCGTSHACTGPGVVHAGGVGGNAGGGLAVCVVVEAVCVAEELEACVSLLMSFLLHQGASWNLELFSVVSDMASWN